jgi:hypothetical protein
MTIATTETKPAPTQETTIQDAVDALFASKEPAKPAPEAPAPVLAETTAEAAIVEQPEAEQVVEPAPEAKPEPKTSASDYALQLARARKKIAALAARQPAAPVATSPSDAAIKRAAAIEAAKGDTVKEFEAAGFELKAIVEAYDRRMAEEGADYPDPLAKEVKALATKLALFEKREKEASDVAAETHFLSVASNLVKASGDKFEYVAAKGTKGLELVKELVLAADEKGEFLPVADALRLAEAHYEEEANELATTKKLASKFTPQTRKPSIPQQAPVTGAAPAKQTAPRPVTDVINEAIDALLPG